jgi:hypothetical protein
MLKAPAALEEFRQALGAAPEDVSPPDWGASNDWAIEGTHGFVSCKPGGGFYVSVFGYTDRGQERAAIAFVKFARLLEIGGDGERLFLMARPPNGDEAKRLRDWLGLRR